MIKILEIQSNILTHKKIKIDPQYIHNLSIQLRFLQKDNKDYEIKVKVFPKNKINEIKHYILQCYNEFFDKKKSKLRESFEGVIVVAKNEQEDSFKNFLTSFEKEIEKKSLIYLKLIKKIKSLKKKKQKNKVKLYINILSKNF